MKLYVDFDDELIQRYVRRGRSPLFTIYWTQDQVSYPEDQWLDFGSVILSWWLVAAKSLLEGATDAEFPFMDGPYGLKVRLLGTLAYVTPEDHSWQWRTSAEDFAEELVSASDRVLKKFNQLGIPDQEGLQVGVQHLRTAMSRAKTTASRSRVLVAEAVTR